ncbi:hypothetical protein Taro_047151 [Colocasia esculenta]|uniref:Uncharacterized protein n=1 Tax=Colocasia esculenta TaxID=4460 RepID=A0A843WS19_COLES|nr:hypothetical protein [Colocasia esculenta]
MFFASTTMKFKCHILMKLRMSRVIALIRFTSQEKARTWPWLGNAGISCMGGPRKEYKQSLLTSPLARRVLRCLGTSLKVLGFAPVDRPVDEEAILLSFTDSLLSGSQQEQGGTEASRSVDVSSRLAATYVDVNRYFKHKPRFKFGTLMRPWALQEHCERDCGALLLWPAEKGEVGAPISARCVRPLHRRDHSNSLGTVFWIAFFIITVLAALTIV